MNKADFFEGQIRLLKKRERFFISLSIILALTIIILIVHMFNQNTIKKDKETGYSLSEKGEIAPYAEEVYAVIKNLKYSGIEMLERDDVTLSLDFVNKVWTLHNLHRFDQSGDIILENGTNGTCGELAAYTYKRIKPIFGDKYEIKFVRSAQSGFFLSEQASHIALYITQKGANPRRNKVYIIDPSFHRYGHISEFEDYLFTEFLDTLPFLEKKETDVDREIHSAIPLFLGGDYLLGFAVESNEGKFDRQNFILCLILTKKYNFSGRYLFAIRNNNGAVEKFENKVLAKQVLNEEEYKGLVDKILLFYRELTR
jgi:hypothetical protein